MAISIGELRGIISLQDSFSKPIEDAAKKMDVFGSSFKVISGLAAASVGAIAAATAGVVALGKSGAEIADVKEAFGALSRGAGETADVMLGALQEGTLNAISNFELMKLANTALGSGMVTSATDMKTLAAGAHLLADATGGDTAEAFQTLTSAMATGRTGGLKQLGLFIDTKVATEAYAKSLGVSVGSLTDSQRAQALSAATLEALRDRLRESGPAAEDFGDLVAQAQVRVQNFVDDLSVAIATSPVVAAGMKAMGEALDKAFGRDQAETVQFLTDKVNQFAIFLVDAASAGVTGVKFLILAFEQTKVVLNTLVEAFFSGWGTILGGMADLGEKAKAIPGVTEAFGGLIDGLRSSADMSKSLAFGFGEMAAKAEDTSAKVMLGADAIQEGLAGVRSAMVAALDAEVEMASGAQVVTANLETMGEAAGLTAAQIKAIEDQTRKGQEALHEASEDMAEKFATLQEELTLANMTGVQQRLQEIEFARQKEIEGLQFIAFMYPEKYEEITALVAEKYQLMSEAAQGHFRTVEEAAAAAGFKTRAEQEDTAAKALKLYNDMVASGKFSYQELQRAHQAYKDAENALNELSAMSAMEKFQLVAESASSILRDLFGKSKAAAIAAVIIDTAAAIVKTLAAYPWPWNLIPAAAVAAAGFAQLSAIKAQNPGFATGTPGTTFKDFGRESMVPLHGPEAVVTPFQAESVGGVIGSMVSKAIRDAQGGGRAGVPNVIVIKIGEREVARVVQEDIRSDRHGTKTLIRQVTNSLNGL